MRSLYLRSLLLAVGLYGLSVWWPSQAQTTRYVSTTGTNANLATATNWGASTADLQGAINASSTGDQVWVAGGLYGSITMKSGVAIYGGFAGGESSLNLRPGVNPTAGQPSSSTLSGNNSSTVVRITQASAATRLDGFVIANGNGSNGGGINNDGIGSGNSSNPTLVNLLITGNRTSNGGGLYNSGAGYGSARPTLTNIVFSQNTAGEGGGIYDDGIYGEASPILINVLFYRNSAVSGGAIYNIAPSNGTCDPVLTNVSFQGNSASNSGGAIYNQGAPGNSESHSKLTNVSFQGNSASSGAAVYNSGNGAEVTLTSAVVFGNDGSNTFAGNGLTIRYSLLESSIPTSAYTGSGNLTTTTSPFMSDSDLRLNACSAAINTGRWDAYSSVNGPNTDLAGQPRFYNNGTIDMGAYEFQGAPGSPAGITQQPISSTSVSAGATVTAAVSVSGTVSAYQWYKDNPGNAVTGQTSATLTLTNVQTTDAGSYSLVVIGACNSVTSTAFSLSVTPVQPIRYVKQGGTGDGTSWANASGDLQSQINAPGVQQVWVAGGVYKPTSTTARNISFSLKSGVAVYGGFPTSGNPDLSTRNLSMPSSTTLSGDIGVTGYSGDNSYHVVRVTNARADTRLDGFVITGGNANSNTNPDNNGGGMYNEGSYGGSSNPVLVNLTFINNSAAMGGPFTMEAVGEGGALYNNATQGSSSPQLINVNFTGNQASSGGALSNNGNSGGNSSPQLTNVSFTSNTAVYSGGAMINTAIDGGVSNPVLTNVTFSQNTATFGRALYNGGFYTSTAGLTIINGVIFGNDGPNTIYNSGPVNLNISNSLLEQGITGYTDNGNNITTTTSPFVSPTSTQLRAGAEAIDAGSTSAYSAVNGPTTDLAGNPRTVHGRIDMGAYEFQGPFCQPIAITQQPVSGSTVCAGSTVTASVSVTGTSPTYQWYKGSTALSSPASATTATLTLTNVQPGDAGSYSVVVIGSCNSVTSIAFSLTVNSQPTLATVTQLAPVCPGQPATIRLTGLPENATLQVRYTINGVDQAPVSITTSNSSQGWMPSDPIPFLTRPLTAADNNAPLTISSLAIISTGCSQTFNTSLSLAVNPSPVASVSANGTLTCTQTSVTLTAGGGSSYQFAGPGVVSQSGNQAVVNVGGPYSVTVTSQNGCSATATTSVGSNRSLATPTLLSQTGQSYPGGQSSLTVTQNSTAVVLVGNGCAGTLNWTGSNATAGTGNITVPASATGTFVFSATCQVGTCTSLPASATVTVIALPPPAVTLSISYQDADNNLTNNIIRPYLQINNEGSNPVAYSQITLRYWLTAEDFSPLVNNLSVYYAQLGTNYVRMRYVPLGQKPRQGAYGYIEYRFEAGAGNLAARSNSGPIQNGIGKNDWTNFNEANDYSYTNAGTYTKNSKITAYVNGQLVWGTEPPLVTPLAANQSVKVYSESKNSATTNTISTYVQVKNEGNVPFAYQTLKVRYWFTTEGNQPINFYLDYAQLGNSKVSGQVVRLPTATVPVSASANAYLELSFTAMGSDSLYPSSSTGSIQYRMAKSDYTNFNQNNDYSYQAVAPLAANPKMSGYLNGTLVYGSEPPAGARLGASEVDNPMKVVVLGNPLVGPTVDIAISGVTGERVTVELVDGQGHRLQEHIIVQASELERVSLFHNGGQGIFLLRVSTPTQNHSVKIVNVH